MIILKDKDHDHHEDYFRAAVSVCLAATYVTADTPVLRATVLKLGTVNGEQVRLFRTGLRLS